MTTDLLLGPNDDGRRADRIIRKALPELPLSAIHRLFRAGKIRIEGKRLKPDSRLQEGQTIKIEKPPADVCPRGVGKRQDQSCHDAQLPKPDILFQNCNFLVINKDEGVLVHGPQSLEEAVRALLADHITASLSFRPGPLHRLDRGTSGIIVFSASLEGARSFSRALHEHQLQKEYLALVDGSLEQELLLDAPLERNREQRQTHISQDGKSARTRVRPIAQAQGTSLVSACIEGGRTHQIRAHLASAGHPLVNDRKYAGSTRREVNGGRFLLHAHRLAQEPGISLDLPLQLEAPLPPEFLQIISSIFGPEVAHLVLY